MFSAQLNDPKLLRQDCYINGKWQSAEGSFEVTNPANGEVIAVVADAGPLYASEAVEAAHAAFSSWRRVTAKERGYILRRWFELIREHAKDLAVIMTAEQGKPMMEALEEVRYGATFVEYYAEEAKRTMGYTIPTVASDRRLQTYKQPVGVVGCITPWNFPSAMISRKAGPALAAGCTVVLKPAPHTPLSALALCELADRAGIPPGVLNVVTSTQSQAIGEVLTQHPKVAKFTFTGSTKIGKQLAAQCATTVKKVSLEMGGNAPFIVFDDADLDAAVKHCVTTKFRNCGQTCVCPNRIFLQESIAEDFTMRLTAAISELSVGVGSDSGVIVGPLINEMAVTNLEVLIQDAIDKGANVIRGGKRHSLGGNFFEPTLLSEVTSDMRLASEEIFGPIAAIQKFRTEEEVVERANDTPFGLAAYFFSRDVGRVMRVSEDLECGIVCSNSGLFTTEVAPFGGWKESGIGSEGGKEGIADFYETKFHSIGGIE